MQREDRVIGKRAWLLLAGVLMFAAIAAMRGTFGGTFIFDDYSLLALPRFFDNPLLPFWHEHVEGGLHYRPMGLALWWISERLFGSTPWPHYLLNAALLGAVAISLWRVVALVSAREGLAFALALIFVVHPIATGTTAWLSNRFELLAALFGLLALGQAWRYRTLQSNSSLVAALILFACGLCAKENTVALISAAFVFWWWPTVARPAWFDRRQLACLWLVALVVLWLMVRKAVLSAHGTDALFAAKPAWLLFRDGMSAWLFKLPSYLLLIPRLGLATGIAFALGGICLMAFALRGARQNWAPDRVAILSAGLAIVAVAAIVQWPRTGLVLMNLKFGSDAFLDVLAARYYFMAALGFIVVIAALSASSPRVGSGSTQRGLAWVTTGLLLIPLFAVSQHLSRSYRGATLEQARFDRAAVDAIDQRTLPANDCQIYLLGTDSKLFGFYADPAVKALTLHLAEVSRCFIQTEIAPWYHLVAASEVERAHSAPFTPVRVGDDNLAPIVLGDGALLFVNTPPDAKPPLGSGSVFLAWQDGAFVDIGDEVRAGRRTIPFACFRPPSQCP
ncbi:MAG: hypothetical protein IPP82_18460 [Xanthomonadales bacterium]|nr:hypothetical protein [Xanthomonadales bacterium]